MRVLRLSHHIPHLVGFTPHISIHLLLSFLPIFATANNTMLHIPLVAVDEQCLRERTGQFGKPAERLQHEQRPGHELRTEHEQRTDSRTT